MWPPSKEEKGFLACYLILFLIKRESWEMGGGEEGRSGCLEGLSQGQ